MNDINLNCGITFEAQTTSREFAKAFLSLDAYAFPIRCKAQHNYINKAVIVPSTIPYL